MFATRIYTAFLLQVKVKLSLGPFRYLPIAAESGAPDHIAWSGLLRFKQFYDPLRTDSVRIRAGQKGRAIPRPVPMPCAVRPMTTGNWKFDVQHRKQTAQLAGMRAEPYTRGRGVRSAG